MLNLVDNLEFEGKLEELRRSLNNWRTETHDLI